MDKIVKNFYKLLLLLACIAMVAAFAVVMLGVAARQFLWDIPGLDAYAGYAIAAALFLALPETLRHGDHIRVTLVLQKLPRRSRVAFEYGCLATATLLSAYFAWFSVRLVWLSFQFHDVSPAADATPLWIPQTLMALGSIGFSVAFADALVSRVRGHDWFELSDGEAARAE